LIKGGITSMKKWISSGIFAFLLLIILLFNTTIATAYSSDFGAVSSIFSLILVLYLLFFVVWIIVAIWVYKDAESRGANGVLWAIIVFFLGLIGLIIYIVIRPSDEKDPFNFNNKESKPDRRCTNCGRPIPMDAKICPYCAKKFESYL
jgi:hypothetical protein